MSRTVTLPDDICGTLLKVLRQEVFALYTSPKEKVRAQEALDALLDAVWVPECPAVISSLPADQLAALQNHLAGAD